MDYSKMSEEEYRKLCQEQAMVVLKWFWDITLYILAFVGLSSILDKVI